MKIIFWLTVIILLLYLGISLDFALNNGISNNFEILKNINFNLDGKESYWGAIGTVLTVIGALIGVYINNEASKKLAHYERLQDKGEKLISLITEITAIHDNYIANYKLISSLKVKGEKVDTAEIGIERLNNMTESLVSYGKIFAVVNLYFPVLIEKMGEKGTNIYNYFDKTKPLDFNSEDFSKNYINPMKEYIIEEIEKARP